MFFMKSGTVFHQRLLSTYMIMFQEGYKLYYRQMVALLPTNKEVCTFRNCFRYFVQRDRKMKKGK